MRAAVSPVRQVSPVRPSGHGFHTKQEPSWWTPQKIDWYVRASMYSDFHKRLAHEIADMVPRGKSVLEVGCGLGYMTAQLDEMGYDVFGIDNDEEAIKKAQELHGNQVSENMKPLESRKNLFALEDYRTSLRTANVMLAVFCGRIDEEGLGAFERLADERIIYIVSQHRANSLRHDRTAEICKYLEESDHRFTFKELTMHFDQPFTSREDATMFLELQHGNSSLPVKRNEGANKDKYPYVFENEKKMSLFDIEV